MVQTTTTRYNDRSAPGFMSSPPQERRTSTACLPTNPQVITLTWGGDDPSVAGDYTITIPLPSGGSYTFIFAATNIALALEGPALAAALLADAVISNLYSPVAVGAVVTLTAKSSQTQIPLASWVVVVPGATTITPAQVAAAGGASLRMGVLYRRSATPATGPAVNQTFREAEEGPASALVTGTTFADIRGMVARKENSTELSPTFIETLPDQYVAPDIFPCLLVGRGDFVVDPASNPITTLTAAIYAVIEGGGGGTVPGALTTDATGNVQVRGGAIDLIKPISDQETPAFGTPQQALVRCKINQPL